MAKQTAANPQKATYHHGDLRRALLDAALVLLAQQDVKALSLRGVARQAGVSHTAPYRHFADKAALLEAVAEEGFIEFGQYLSAAAEAAGSDPVIGLTDTGIAYVRYALDHPTHFRVMFSHFPNQPAPDSTLPETSDATFQILVDIVEAGQAQGRFKAGNAKELSLERWALVHGIAMLVLDGMVALEGEACPAQELTVKQDSLQLVETLIKSSINGILA